MKLLTQTEVCERLGVTHGTIRNLRKRGDFPEPAKVTERALRWDEADIAAWIEARKGKA